MSITCLKGGTLASFQDEGRIGFQNLGIISSGAIDITALKIANMIVGNERTAACLEVTMRGTTLRFNKDTLIAITGGDLQPVLNKEELVPQWRPVFIRAGSVLKFKGNRIGFRSYVAISGGYELAEQLGSKSTYLRASVGGYKGRAIQEGDQIAHGDIMEEREVIFNKLKNSAQENMKGTGWHVRPDFYKKNRSEFLISYMKGNEYDWFTEAAKNVFATQKYKVESSSDRMGYRLSGEFLQKNKQREMISEAVANGTVQISNDGSPIILLADRQTMGGYARIAQICTADLYKFGQIKPRDEIKFKEVTLDESYQLMAELEKQLRQIELSITFKLI